MKRVNLIALIHVGTWSVAILVSLFTKGNLAWAKVLRPLGFSVFLLGMAMFSWAIAHLGKGFLGNIEPVSDVLVTSSPYRFARHPAYLGMVIATFGLVLGLGSIWGMTALFALFVPASICRASREEKGLALRFGREWEEYAGRTPFMLP